MPGYLGLDGLIPLFKLISAEKPWGLNEEITAQGLLTLHGNHLMLQEVH